MLMFKGFWVMSLLRLESMFCSLNLRCSPLVQARFFFFCANKLRSFAFGTLHMETIQVVTHVGHSPVVKTK